MTQVQDGKPTLSVVIAIVSDTTSARASSTHLARCLAALREQVAPPTMEILVPYHPSTAGIEALRAEYPEVTFLPIADLTGFTGQANSRSHHDVLRARGIAAATGDIVALIEDVGRPAPQWSAAIVKAHAGSYAAVGGAIENGIDRPLNWAVYFCDFGRYQNPVPEGESASVSDADVSYKRLALTSIRKVWEDSFREPLVNSALVRRGEKLALSRDIVVFQCREGLRLGSALKERFIWGRSYAAARGRLVGTSRRLVYAVSSPLLPILLLIRMARNVMNRRRALSPFLRALPLIMVLLCSWACGELVGYLWLAEPAGRPAPGVAGPAPKVTR